MSCEPVYYYGLSGGPSRPDGEELCACGLPGCKRTLKEAEDEYRQGVIISACARQWPLLYRLHRILKKLQRRYPSFDAAQADQKAQKLWDAFYETYGVIQMAVDEDLWRVEDFKKKHGRYEGMMRRTDSDVGTEGTKAV